MKKIKLFSPHVGKSEETVIKKVLHSGFWASGAGVGQVAKFEKAFQKFTQSKSCISVNSGTAALHLALSLFGIKNSEVIIPSLSFVSTAHSVVYNGGKPVFVDIDPETLCIDEKMIERHITHKTKAILPVHFGGMPAKIEKIKKICKKYNLKLIEDAAHAAGTNSGKSKIGSHGDAVCFSFHPVKNLAMPNGGAITLNGNNLKENEKKLKSLRWCGISNRKGTTYDVTNLGWNYYMNEFSAGIGIEQLKKLEKMNKTRKEIAKRYSNEIGIDRKMQFSDDCSYHLYWIIVKNRNRFMKLMQNEGIETGIHYLPIHKMKYYSSKKNLPVTEEVSKNIVSLPIHPHLSSEEVTKIIKSVNKFV